MPVTAWNTFNWKVVDLVCGIASVTVIVNVNGALVNNNGVPEIYPVALLKLNPNGNPLTEVSNAYV